MHAHTLYASTDIIFSQRATTRLLTCWPALAGPAANTPALLPDRWVCVSNVFFVLYSKILVLR